MDNFFSNETVEVALKAYSHFDKGTAVIAMATTGGVTIYAGGWTIANAPLAGPLAPVAVGAGVFIGGLGVVAVGSAAFAGYVFWAPQPTPNIAQFYGP